MAKTDTLLLPSLNVTQEMEMIDNKQNEIHVVDEQGEVRDGLQEITAKGHPVHRHPKLEVDEEKGISWAEVGFSEGKITRYVYGDKLIVNIEPVSKTTKRAKSSKFKTCIVLSVTSQLSGSLMAVSKHGSVQVQALSYSSAACNAAGFLSSVGALWLWRTRPKLASALEAVGWGFAVCGFLGMMAIFVL